MLCLHLLHTAPDRWHRQSSDESMRKNHGDSLPVLLPAPNQHDESESALSENCNRLVAVGETGF